MRNAWLGLIIVSALGCSSSAGTSNTSASASGSDTGGKSSSGGTSAGTTGDSAATGSTSGDPTSSFGGGSSGGTGTGGGTSTSAPGTAGPTGSSSGETAAASDASAPDASTVAPSEAGILTAGIWDDGLNYDFFSSYLAGRGQIDGDPGFATSDYDAAHGLFTTRSVHTSIDATLVIDTTGSMGDELSYLTAEFANITAAIAAKFPGSDQRWALVVYRDTPDTDPGDDYVVKHYDFTTNMADFAKTVGAQDANNGGDYPESPELGLEEMQKLSWRTDASVAKLAFWVADAPQHDYRAAAMKKAISDTAASGIHVYPVSGSGTDDLLELTMRSAAELTGGRYMFLTDDSGVGDPHKVPEIPCFFVTKLAKDLVRAVSMELTATYIGPEASDIIRTVGSPSSAGQCPVQDGGTVQIF